jgi:hypothetical protein
MSLSYTGLILLKTSVGNGPNLWLYNTTDAHTDVDAAGYFTDADAQGMKVGDIVIVADTDAPTVTIHRVQSMSSGAATISSATLA